MDQGKLRGTGPGDVHGGWRHLCIVEDRVGPSRFRPAVVGLWFVKQRRVRSRLGDCNPIGHHRLRWGGPRALLLSALPADDRNWSTAEPSSMSGMGRKRTLPQFRSQLAGTDGVTTAPECNSLLEVLRTPCLRHSSPGPALMTKVTKCHERVSHFPAAFQQLSAARIQRLDNKNLMTHILAVSRRI